MRLRKGNVEEHGLLTDLAMRSKAYWGYDVNFLAACRRDLTITEAMIREGACFVAEGDDGAVVGFSLVLLSTPTAVLDHLFIDPKAIGTGFGRQLFCRALEAARAAGASAMRWDADPHAEDFYCHMGAEVVGSVESTSMSGRYLPQMEIRF